MLACCPDWRPLQILFLVYRFPLVAAFTRFASSSVSVRDRPLVRRSQRPISGLATCAMADEALAIWASEAPEENQFLKICNRPYSCQNRIFTPPNSVRQIKSMQLCLSTTTMPYMHFPSHTFNSLNVRVAAKTINAPTQQR